MKISSKLRCVSKQGRTDEIERVYLFQISAAQKLEYSRILSRILVYSNTLRLTSVQHFFAAAFSSASFFRAAASRTFTCTLPLVVPGSYIPSLLALTYIALTSLPLKSTATPTYSLLPCIHPNDLYPKSSMWSFSLIPTTLSVYLISTALPFVSNMIGKGYDNLSVERRRVLSKKGRRAGLKRNGKRILPNPRCISHPLG